MNKKSANYSIEMEIDASEPRAYFHRNESSLVKSLYKKSVCKTNKLFLIT